MNLKNITIAFIISLVYEILLKLSHIVTPSIFNFSLVSGITSVLSFVVGITIIMFMYFFYKEEKFNKNIELILKILIGFIVIHFIIRLPIAERMIDFKVVRLVGEVFGFIKSILFFAFLILYKREIPSNEKLIAQATVFITIMFGFGIIKSFYSVINFSLFVISGITINYSPIFYNIMFILFLATHVSIIYFLYCYYRLKFSAK